MNFRVSFEFRRSLFKLTLDLLAKYARQSAALNEFTFPEQSTLLLPHIWPESREELILFGQENLFASLLHRPRWYRLKIARKISIACKQRLIFLWEGAIRFFLFRRSSPKTRYLLLKILNYKFAL